ncbi:MAG: ATP-binding protein [Wenzhouxiangella sp.]
MTGSRLKPCVVVATGSGLPGSEPGAAPVRSRPPSLLLRLTVSAAIALSVSLALVGLAVDRGYRAASADALQERLSSTVFLLLSTLDLTPAGQPRMSDRLAEPRLEQPGAGLYAGAITAAGAWQSASLTGVLDAPKPEPLPRGRERFAGPDSQARFFSFAMGLGWELPDGEIIELTLWAAEDPARYRAQVAAFRADLWRWLGVAAVLLIVVQGLILLLSLRPLRRVALEVGQIEAGERERLSTTYPRELAPLTANLNALLASERSNATHYRQALADLAHALKTPLAVMKARLEAGETVEPPAAMEELARMERLIKRQLERAARSTRRTLNQPVAVGPLLQRLGESLQRLYRDKAVVIDVRGDGAVTLRIDERDLMELCGNLLDNAAKYGSGRVLAEVRTGPAGAREAGVEIRIEDNGPGLDPATFARLLERGARGDEQAEGQGLGLAIARQLVEAYAGQIACEASATLGGCAIVVRFPPR